MRIREAYFRGDYIEMARIGLDQFGIQADPGKVRGAVRDWILWASEQPRLIKVESLGEGHTQDQDWSESSWMHWLKNRMIQTLPGTKQGIFSDVSIPVLLHVGFLSILETDEELAILRQEAVKLPFNFARSKVFGTNLATIDPIDMVAARVAPHRAD